MNVKVEKTENNNEVKLEFTVEAEKFDGAIKTVFNKNSKYFNIPGFRKGKAPYQIVEKTYGAQIFYEDAFNEVAGEAFEEGLKENNIEAVSKPEVEIKQIEKGKDLIFTAVVQTKPEVTLGKYKGIQVKKVEYNVSDEDVEHELMHMAEKNARLVSVEDRPVESGDITVIDFEGFVDGVAFDGGKAENHELTIGSNTFIPGFEDQIIGMKPEEEKEILDINITNDYLQRVGSKIFDTRKSTPKKEESIDLAGLKKDEIMLIGEISQMLKNILIENKGREGEAYTTVEYVHHFIENLSTTKELKYILGYFSKNFGYTDPNKFAFDENNQYILESIMYSAMTLYSNGGASRTKLTESHRRWEAMLNSKKEEKLTRTQELNTAKIRALRELGYDEIDKNNASEVLDKIAEIMAQKF